MKKDNKKELRKLNIEELNEKIREKQKELFNAEKNMRAGTRRRAYTKDDKGKGNVRQIKRTIATLKTIIREKELEAMK